MSRPYCVAMTGIDEPTATDDHVDLDHATDDFPQGMLASPTRIQL
ncbi:hypothetical protein BH11ACT8_BH11ACT8_34060 [soil metagenome]